MSNTLKFKVHNCRAGGQHSVMGCDLAVGYETKSGDFVGVLDCRGLWLKRKKDGSGFFVSFPAKQRVDKNGQAVQKNGYNVWDNHIDLYMEEGANPDMPDKRGITDAAWNFREWLIAEMVSASEQMDAPQQGRGAPRSQPPRGAPAPAARPQATGSRPASRPAPVAASRPTKPVAVEEEDEDDGFPF